MSKIQTIGIVGAGQMGRGIAQVVAQSGYDALLYDVSVQGLKEAIDFINKQLTRGVEKGKWTQEDKEKTLARIHKTEELDSFKACNLVIEAASENKKIKFDIFKKLDELTKKDTLLASNTSSISITEIAAVTNRPEKVAGMHFMNPVPVM